MPATVIMFGHFRHSSYSRGYPGHCRAYARRSWIRMAQPVVNKSCSQLSLVVILIVPSSSPRHRHRHRPPLVTSWMCLGETSVPHSAPHSVREAYDVVGTNIRTAFRTAFCTRNLSCSWDKRQYRIPHRILYRKPIMFLGQASAPHSAPHSIYGKPMMLGQTSVPHSAPHSVDGKPIMFLGQTSVPHSTPHSVYGKPIMFLGQTLINFHACMCNIYFP